MIIEGTFVNHDGRFNGQVSCCDETGRILAIGEDLGHADYKYHKDCLIFPGMGDIHIHAREDVSKTQTYKEDFCSCSAAALHGGVVQVVDMPNNPEAPIDDATYNAKLALTKDQPVHFTLYAGIGPETKPLERKVPYKAFMGPSIGQLFFSSSEQLEDTIKDYRGCHVSFHCEDPYILEVSKDNATHSERRPRGAVNTATAFALYLIEKYELVGKLCHFSSGDGLELVKAARKRGVNVSVEVTPQQLYWNRSSMSTAEKPWLQMNPAFRYESDRVALIEGLRNGDVDYLATDHAPHRIYEKLRNFHTAEIIALLPKATTEEDRQELDRLSQEAYEKVCAENPERLAELADTDGTSGTPQLDTYGAFTTWLMEEQGFSAEDVARVCSFNPGNFVNQFEMNENTYGRVEEGYAASFTVINLEKSVTISNADVKSKCAWTPFNTIEFPGSVEAVFIGSAKI